MSKSQFVSEVHSRINFPLYSVAALSSNHVVVGGGGGSAKTGVFNGFSICEIVYDLKKSSYFVSEIQRVNTPTAIMNCAIGNIGKKIFMAAGKDDDCSIFQIRLTKKVQNEENIESKQSKEDHSGELRQRGKANEDITNSKKSPEINSLGEKDLFEQEYQDSQLVFEIKNIMEVKTDFGSEPYQNIVAFSRDTRLVLTGGTDGHIRVWTFPEMQLRSTIEAAKGKEVNDLDISYDRKYVSSITKDGKCRIWTLSDGKMICSLDLPPDDQGKFLYKRCRFGLVDDRKRTERLYVILNPINYKKNKSYIQHWTNDINSGGSFQLSRVACAGDALSALAISHCGKYIAVGSMTTGDVQIFISFNLQLLKKIEKAHRTFVTGLSFLPAASVNEDLVLAECDAAVVSISVDNQIKIHYIDKTNGIPMWLAVILIIFVLIGTFVICSILDL